MKETWPHPALDYEQMFLQTPVGICLSEHRVIRTCNNALALMFGHKKEELTGKSLLDLYPSADEFRRIGARIEAAMRSASSYSDERIMKRASGELFWCHAVGRALTSHDPHAAAIWVFFDLSTKRPVVPSLSPREREVAALMLEGMTSKSIAQRIGLSRRTVEMYRSQLKRKCIAKNSLSAMQSTVVLQASQ